MKRYTLWMSIAILGLVAIMAATSHLSWADIGNNLIVGLVTALLTVSVVHRIMELDRRRQEGRWASEVIFIETVDVANTVRQAARFLLADLPPGVEAAEQWGAIAKAYSMKRHRLAPLLAKDILLAVVELEDELNRLEFVTARGEESRKEYGRQILQVWRRYRHLMDCMLDSHDDLRKDLLHEPNELITLRRQYGLDEHG